MQYTYDGEWVISSVIDDRAERFPDRRFVESADGDLTYGMARDRAQRVAGALVALGVEPGDRVATMLPSSLEYLAAWFGVVWAGAVDVPINNDYKGFFLEHVLRQSGAKVAVILDRWVSRLDGLDLPDLDHVVVVGDQGDVPPGLTGHDFAGVLDHDPVGRVPRTEQDLVYIMYTSGTTGPSKGVMHGNRSALWNSRAWIDILSMSHEDVAYSMFPLFHVTARSALFGTTLWAGSRIALRNGFSLGGFWDDVRATGATFFAYMGAVIHLLHAQEPQPTDADHNLRIAFGAAAPPEIITDFERRFGFRLIEVYGSTELGVATAPVGGEPKRGTMGPPCGHLQIEVHDSHDRPVPPGIEGEIVARPAVREAMFQGYWQNAQASVEAFRNLWFHTGDGGTFDDDGHLIFTDRIKDSIRRRGENISSFEVERAVQGHPAVLECGAYAVPAEITEDEVMIAVVLREDAAVRPEDVFRYCIDEMPRFAVPRYLRFVDELPKTPSQRIQKYKLRDEGVTADSYDREALGIVVPRS
jgi:crotonobetaine/carnitine-CoA ligase